MAIDFPNSPALNQLYTSGWSTWMWDGVKWMASMPSGGVYEPVFGGTQYPMYGFLYNKTVGDPGYSTWAGFGAHTWRFGTNPGDDFSAGMIDYRSVVSDALSIVGAGTTAGGRKINLYDNVNVAGNLTVGTTTILGSGGGIFSVGQITATGPLAISGPVGTTGSSAILTFQDRTGTTNWGWYAQAGVARLWNDQSGDRITIDSGGSITTPGNIRTGGNLYNGGPYLYFSGVTAGGPFIFGGTTDIATQLGTGNGAFKWYSNPGAELMRLDSTGTLVNHSEIHSQGSLASLWFQDRGGAYEWAWYADSNQAHLYNTYGGVGRVVANVDVNGQASFAQGVYGAAFAINGTGHYLYDALSGHFGFRAGGAAGPYGYASLGADSSWTCGDIHAGNIFAPNFLINDGSAATAGTFGFVSGNGPGIQIWGNTSPGAGSIIFSGSTGTTLFKSDSVGNITTAGTINVGSGVIELGQNRGGDGYAYVDFHAQAGTDYDFRIIRNPGANGGASIVQNGSAPLTFAAPSFSFNGGTDINGYLNVNNGNNLGVSGSVAAYGGQIVCYNSNLNGFYVANANGHFMRMYDDGQGHIESSSGSIYIGYTNGVSAYVGGGVNCADLFSRANLNCAGSVGGSGNYLYLSGWGNGNVNSTGGPFLYMDSNWIIPHLGPGNTGFAIQNTNGSNLFQIDSAGGLLCYGNLQGNSTFNFNGTGSFQNTIYTNHVVMNNACLLYGRDTAGTQQWLISLWSDNVIYVGDGSHDLHLRGYTTYCDNSNEFRCNNAIHAVGSNAMLYFDDRTDGVVWGWYAHNSVVHLYSNLDGDRVAIDRGGNISTGGIFTAWDIHANSGLFCNGLLFQNYTGWWWTGSPIHTDSDIQCNGSLYFGGNRLYNNSGYAYFDQTVHAAGVYSRGDIWNAGNINAGNQVNGAYIHSTGDARCDGSYTCGGWYYGGGNGGAQIRCWAGDWGAMSYAMSGGYFEVSPDQGASGYVLQPVTSWSDARLKLNIRDSEIDALAVFKAVPIRAFEWTDRGRKFMPGVGPVSCGIVAQELAELIPSAVDAAPLLGEGMLRIVSDHLDAYYIRAIQQLLARIEELENLVLNPPERNLA